MNTLEWIVLVVGIAAALVLLAMFVRIRRRRAHLQEQFGPEYQRAVADQGTGGGEKRLSEIESERNDLEIRPLAPAARDRYLDEWRQAEARFVSDPRDATRAAEALVDSRARGAWLPARRRRRAARRARLGRPPRRGGPLSPRSRDARERRRQPEHREPPQGDARLPQRARGRRRRAVTHRRVARGRLPGLPHGVALRRSPRHRTGVRRS